MRRLPVFFLLYPPKLPLGGGTRLGGALDALMTETDTSVARSTPQRKGDWPPVVYLFTDGRPTDDPGPAIERWRSRYAGSAKLIAVGIGQDADLSPLKRLTDRVILFEEVHEGDYRKFVDWVSASILAKSQRLGDGRADEVDRVLDECVLSLVKEPPPVRADAACVTLVGRCQQTRKPYLIKYDREHQRVATSDFSVDVSMYRLTSCYPLEESYFDWSDPRTSGLEVSTSELLGVPGCPHCGNATAFALCGCGKLMCVNGPGDGTCPWCGKAVSFAPGPSPDEGGFAVGRGLG